MEVRTRCRPIWWVLALMSFILALSMNVGVHASQINKDLFVDKISVSQSEAFVGESVKMEIEFSEKNGNKFKPGDQMIFDLPAELEGFIDQLDLEDYATVSVEHGRAVVTFTDVVAVKQNIKGKLLFSVNVKMNLADNSEKVLPLNFGTQAQNVPSLKVKGHKTDRPNPRPKTSYKGGHVDLKDPTIMNWYVVVNANALPIWGNVVVTDELGPGHIYVPGSFKFNGPTDQPTPRVNIRGKKVSGDTFTVTMPESYISGRGVQISYQTRLTKAGKKMKEVKNNFFTKFEAGHNNPESMGGGWQLANLLIKGIIEGDDAIKHETENELDPIELETLDDNDNIAPIELDTGNEVFEPNHLEDSIHGSRPEIHINPTEEMVPEGHEENVDPITPEKGEETEEDAVLEDELHGTRPEIHIDMTEEVIPEGHLDIVEPIVPDKGIESQDDTQLEDDIHGNMPEIHMSETEEVVPGEELEEIAPITPEKGEETTEEDRLDDGVQEAQPEIHVHEMEEVVPETDVEEIAPIESEKGKETTEDSHLEDAVQELQPEIHVDVMEETVPEEDVKVIDPITPEYIDGEDVVEMVEEEQPTPLPAPKGHVKPERTDVDNENPTTERTDDLVDPMVVEETPKAMPAPKAHVKPERLKVNEPKHMVTNQVAMKKAETKQVVLPNTGSSENFVLTIAGLLGLMFTGLVVMRRQK